jgi:hypothetical protein
LRFARNVRLAGLLATISAAVVLAAPPAWAATISVSNLTGDGIAIGADVQKAVLGINMTGGGTVSGVDVVLEDAGTEGNFDLATLSDLQASPDGVAVYRDNGTVPDQLDVSDTRVSSGFTNSNGDVSVNINPAASVPNGTEGAYTFFLTVRTSNTIANGDDFTVSIPSPILGCAFTTSPGTLLCNGAGTGTITADTTVPTATMTSAPTTVDGNDQPDRLADAGRDLRHDRQPRERGHARGRCRREHRCQHARHIQFDGRGFHPGCRSRQPVVPDHRAEPRRHVQLRVRQGHRLPDRRRLGRRR